MLMTLQYGLSHPDKGTVKFTKLYTVSYWTIINKILTKIRWALKYMWMTAQCQTQKVVRKVDESIRTNKHRDSGRKNMKLPSKGGCRWRTNLHGK